MTLVEMLKCTNGAYEVSTLSDRSKACTDYRAIFSTQLVSRKPSVLE